MKKKLSEDYVVCMYIRLSMEDDDVGSAPLKNESNSITNQRALIRQYLNRHEEFADCRVIERCDDGISGTHFDTRPQCTDMLEMAKRGDIDCIIVKDFSRFGRNYIELGDYLEQVFPFLSIRFISINDGYDSDELPQGAAGGLDTAFKNIIYDYYSRELSKKQKLVWRRFAESGRYNSSCALYGYDKAEDDKHQLVINEQEAAVVREIFELKIAGYGTSYIAKSLNDRGVLCPSEQYKEYGNDRKWKTVGTGCIWTACMIEKILRDEKYTGTMVMLKTRLDSVGGRQIANPPEEWIRTEGTHEPIISKKMYRKAVSMLGVQKKKEHSGCRNIYRCGICGRALVNRKTGNMFCNCKRFMENTECKNVCFSRKKADNIVLKALQCRVSVYLDNFSLSVGNKRNDSAGFDEEVKSLLVSMKSTQNTWRSLYNKYADGQISRESFIEEKKVYDSKMSEMQERLNTLKMIQEGSEDTPEDVDFFQKVVQAEELTEEIKDSFVGCVYVYPEERLEVRWSYCDDSEWL